MKFVPYMLLVAAMLCICAVGPAWANDATPVEGSYSITGWEPETQHTPDNAYAGMITVLKVGDAYTFDGQVDGIHYRGVGLYDARARVLSWCFEGATPAERGVTLLQWDGASLQGKWTLLGDDRGKAGWEIWKPVGTSNE